MSDTTKPRPLAPANYEWFLLRSPAGDTGILGVSVSDNDIDVVTPGWSMERMEIESHPRLRLVGEG